MERPAARDHGLRDHLPSDEDVASYEEQGYWVSPIMLPEALLDRAMEGARRFYAGERDRPLPVTGGFSDTATDSSAPIRNNEFVSLQCDAIAALVRTPVIGAVAARLARTPSIRLLDDQLVYKAPSDGSPETITGWHADHAYWGTCSSNDMLTAWIPLHDVDEDRSPLVVMPGSHRWTGIAHTRHFNVRDLGALERRLAAEGRNVERRTVTLRKGQVSFHHCWTLHAASPNRSPYERLAVAVHLQDEANRYRPAVDPQGRPVRIADELFCRRDAHGDPDFTDPAAFPVIWPAGPTEDEGGRAP